MPEMTVDQRLEQAFDAIAVCHCGGLCRDHTQSDNHSPVWMECEDSKLLSDARHELSGLRERLRAAEEKVGELSTPDLFFYEGFFDEAYGSIGKLVEMETLSVGDTFSIHRARVIDAIQVRIEAQNNGEYRLIDTTTGKEIEQ